MSIIDDELGSKGGLSVARAQLFDIEIRGVPALLINSAACTVRVGRPGAATALSPGPPSACTTGGDPEVILWVAGSVMVFEKGGNGVLG